MSVSPPPAISASGVCTDRVDSMMTTYLGFLSEQNLPIPTDDRQINTLRQLFATVVLEMISNGQSIVDTIAPSVSVQKTDTDIVNRVNALKFMFDILPASPEGLHDRIQADDELWSYVQRRSISAQLSMIAWLFGQVKDPHVMNYFNAQGVPCAVVESDDQDPIIFQACAEEDHDLVKSRMTSGQPRVFASKNVTRPHVLNFSVTGAILVGAVKGANEHKSEPTG